MTLNQCMSPNLSETPMMQQAQACKQGGFTLVELMVVIAILGILTGIVSGAWRSVLADKQVDAAAGKLRSAMVAARMKALTTGKTQYVGVDLVNHKIASTVSDGSNAYTKATDKWSLAIVWEPVDKIVFKESSSAGVPTAGSPSIKTFYFKSTGKVFKTGSKFSLLMQSKDTSVLHKLVLTVNKVTGRVQVKKI
ncbi:MAG: prepilin-type N-terminal cleavage/methylation domain-containing protein [Ghiorsea sp.]|nr:prepilin-type N-terminal cleavage/methylation domain-containing protein [Ghiorsea sp.]